MIYLILSVLCSTLLSLIFKGFERYGINNFQAIVFNYAVCVACATLTLGHSIATPQFWQQAWFPYALIVGTIFISAFTIIAITIQKFGVTVGAIMQKMSILISVTFAIFFYQESTTPLKILGLILAIASIILTNIQTHKNEKPPLPLRMWLYPAYVWLSAGVAEIFLHYVEVKLTSGNSNLQFVGFLFGTAGTIGGLVLLIQLLIGKQQLQWKNLWAGIILGIPNFGSIYFLMKVLGMDWEGSVVFPINNVAIIIFSVIFAVLFMNERLNKWNIIGVLLAILSILLISQ